MLQHFLCIQHSKQLLKSTISCNSHRRTALRTLFSIQNHRALELTWPHGTPWSLMGSQQCPDEKHSAPLPSSSTATSHPWAQPLCLSTHSPALRPLSLLHDPRYPYVFTFVSLEWSWANLDPFISSIKFRCAGISTAVSYST